MPPVIYTRQRQILDFISQFIDANGCAPTLKQIAQAIGVSSLATVHEHLQALERKGLIKKKVGDTRGIELTSITPKTAVGIDVPIMGFIAAGAPIEPYTDPNATLAIPPAMFSSTKRIFVLQVRGESMIEVGINDGDYVVIEQQENAMNGEIVVALLENGMATLKRYFKEATRIRLEPANRTMSPIYARNVTVQGRVVGLIRKYAN
ncbi:MAG: repressor LexA [Candidatus Blackburnbacteria bacterium RIFCSPLOWO2_02_FULL_44_9]|uniref:LexA repressor n=1 Tax=Candidatus Blackburnbacteria bacterium RIFCSPHIGHO2_02_FULL_44_20 TaxID=1797516 RepID=A0A1G1V6K0_9BACT|nr:MAG: repressor LexA [Candidatus Blackburnbacteria bacterium RIFCSPHIGHO2_02_FULL_44_20]OGY12167.1 MAG: repressor LexA [Candidatus Blackburnbacteria bacterium RIFCSPHIGHO2_12_FULL_44_25]OGY17235.1 MAG: repressor LexA [Candidatus Blackburnbacteria bacterium RIFCSPLOWO2_02_FULL_44_9]